MLIIFVFCMIGHLVLGEGASVNVNHMQSQEHIFKPLMNGYTRSWAGCGYEVVYLVQDTYD